MEAVKLNSAALEYASYCLRLDTPVMENAV